MIRDSQEWPSFIAQLRDLAVLQEIRPDQLPPHEEVGWLLLLCSDGHRFRDTFNHHLDKCGHGPCHHPLSYPGGALVLGDSSPLARTKRGYHADEVLIDGIDDSLKLKMLRNMAVYTHFPCSAAEAARLSPSEQFDLFESAFERLRGTFPHTQVVAFCHVHYPDNRYRSYVVDIERYKNSKSKITTDYGMQECA